MGGARIFQTSLTQTVAEVGRDEHTSSVMSLKPESYEFVNDDWFIQNVTSVPSRTEEAAVSVATDCCQQMPVDFIGLMR
jgi:hypothetical protein